MFTSLIFDDVSERHVRHNIKEHVDQRITALKLNAMKRHNGYSLVRNSLHPGRVVVLHPARETPQCSKNLI